MGNSDSTDRLLAQVSAGDPQAREALADRYRQRLRRLIELRLDPRIQARIDPSDVVQETLLDAFRRLPDYLSRRQIPFYLRAGRAVNLSALIAKYPQCAAELESLLPTMRALAQLPCPESRLSAAASTNLAGDVPQRLLGDFRILREIGRGGMGVVYEAEQLSLARRVAVKLFAQGTIVHDKHLRRFKNEARAAATLEHPHIVPVYWVGEEKGIHFYAMKLIHGRSLADLIDQLQRARLKPIEHGTAGATAETPAAQGNEPPSTCEGRRDAQISTDAERLSQSWTASLTNPGDYFRAVAKLMVDAADALAHAHEHGIVHRDIKPGNLLVDERGHVYVTDFGVARIESEMALTFTGDIVGTLRYMSPEQAAGKRLAVDHRTDVYSLGITLYELLTLRPAFQGETREQILRQVLEDEPTAPRRVDPAIPEELETITLKAIEKDAANRYASAQDLADDLRRFRDHLPIRARRSTLAEWSIKWTRRHAPLVATAALALGVTVVALGVAALVSLHSRREAVLAYETAETQRQIAERYLSDIFNSVTPMMGRLHRDNHQYPPEIRALHNGLARDTIALYDRFLENRSTDPYVQCEQAKLHVHKAYLWEILGESAQADASYRNSLDIMERLVTDHPKVALFRSDYGARCGAYALALFDQGRSEEASVRYRQALQLWEEALALDGGNITNLLRLAGLFGTCPIESLRNPVRAVDYLRRIPPGEEDPILAGQIMYRAGRYGEALQYLESSPAEMQNVDKGALAFFLAMSYCRLGRDAEARAAYRDAVAWVEEHWPNHPSYDRFRREAAQVLGTDTPR